MTETQADQLVKLLTLLQEECSCGTSIPGEVFNTLLKVLPQIAVESVIARRIPDGTRRGRIEVYLVQRSSNAPSHQGQWHSPGSFLRQRETVAQVMQRISEQEISPATITSWHQVRVQNNQLEPRGHTVSWIFSCVISGEPGSPNGQWFWIDDLPLKLLDHHADLIGAGVQPILTEPFLS